jgi:hypothetical protein
MRDVGDPVRTKPLGRRLELAIDSDAAEASELSSTLRVRGRFNFRSGSWGSDFSAGEPVTDLDFLLLFLGLVVSICLALSNAPHALVSSTVSTGGGGVGSRSRVGAEARKMLPAP